MKLIYNNRNIDKDDIMDNDEKIISLLNEMNGKIDKNSVGIQLLSDKVDKNSAETKHDINMLAASIRDIANAQTLMIERMEVMESDIKKLTAVVGDILRVQRIILNKLDTLSGTVNQLTEYTVDLGERVLALEKAAI
jgi:hypothetical protein